MPICPNSQMLCKLQLFANTFFFSSCDLQLLTHWYGSLLLSSLLPHIHSILNAKVPAPTILELLLSFLAFACPSIPSLFNLSFRLYSLLHLPLACIAPAVPFTTFVFLNLYCCITFLCDNTSNLLIGDFRITIDDPCDAATPQLFSLFRCFFWSPPGLTLLPSCHGPGL